MTSDLANRCAIAVMAKAPQAGRVKTRLCPPLVPEQAMSLSSAFLQDITANIKHAAQHVPVDGWVAYAPAGDEALFDGILAQGTRLLLADGSIGPFEGLHGFGLCLLHAVRDLLAMGYGSAIVLNADSPTLPTERLIEAATVLSRGRRHAVLGPAEDGGYYLLGLCEPHAHAFAHVTWSSGMVAEQTRDRCRELGLDLRELPVWYDVDTGDALMRLIDELEEDREKARPCRAPATAACLEHLNICAARVAG